MPLSPAAKMFLKELDPQSKNYFEDHEMVVIETRLSLDLLDKMRIKAKKNNMSVSELLSITALSMPDEFLDEFAEEYIKRNKTSDAES